MIFKKTLVLAVLAIMVVVCFSFSGTALAQKKDAFPKVEVDRGKQDANSIKPGGIFKPERDSMMPGTPEGTGSIEPGDNFNPVQRPVDPH